MLNRCKYRISPTCNINILRSPCSVKSQAPSTCSGDRNPRPLVRHHTYPQSGPSNAASATPEVGFKSPTGNGTARPKLARSQSEQITRLPRYTYEDYTPRACVVHTGHEGEVDDLVSALAPGPIAFDMEWRYFLEKNVPPKMNRAAVVQLADLKGMILVIQIFHMKRFPQNLQAIIESPVIPKLGVNILGDGRKLFQDYGIVARNLIELGGVVIQADIVPTVYQDGSQQDSKASKSGWRKADLVNRGPFGRKVVSLAKVNHL
ncbi:hypothetical protein BDN72DRAFT_88814 [Pluteus cervinus]|uniref:Uncharacterized protein n=1 Tax=Pluteus cervinus TaxID=181527 RepID=A0ACD3ART0_9AGAR|nr:hypothetical protein BDN72DRAFT_88814 [Pluteus cervinus]